MKRIGIGNTVAFFVSVINWHRDCWRISKVTGKYPF